MTPSSGIRGRGSDASYLLDPRLRHLLDGRGHGHLPDERSAARIMPTHRGGEIREDGEREGDQPDAISAFDSFSISGISSQSPML
jgi:hypothetical protein